jgi:hypothetical protein
MKTIPTEHPFLWIAFLVFTQSSFIFMCVTASSKFLAVLCANDPFVSLRLIVEHKNFHTLKQRSQIGKHIKPLRETCQSFRKL